MKAGQTTPCAAIPDSGTTVMMAPQHHITSMFADLCTQWPRCMGKAELMQKDLEKKMKTKGKGNIIAKLMKKLKMKEDITKSTKWLAVIFQKLLLTCNDFVNTTHGLDQELPPLNFHLAGSNGKKQSLKLKGVDYVYETMEEDIHHVKKNLYGIFPVDVPVSKGKKKVCTPAFAKSSYDTKLNGPVWVLGLPLFYKFQVGYELNTKPPAMSFTEEPCGSCGADSLVQEAPAFVEGAASVIRRPRLVRGASRFPTLPVTEL